MEKDPCNFFFMYSFITKGKAISVKREFRVSFAGGGGMNEHKKEISGELFSVWPTGEDKGIQRFFLLLLCFFLCFFLLKCKKKGFFIYRHASPHQSPMSNYDVSLSTN